MCEIIREISNLMYFSLMFPLIKHLSHRYCVRFLELRPHLYVWRANLMEFPNVNIIYLISLYDGTQHHLRIYFSSINLFSILSLISVDYRSNEINIPNTSLLDHQDLDIYVVQFGYSKWYVFYKEMVKVTSLLKQKIYNTSY